MRSPSPPAKRVKLEAETTPPLESVDESQSLEESDGEHCSICLQPYLDRTVIPTCAHEFCFECLLIWTEQSRRCPLCSQDIGKYLMHHIRSKYDYQKHYLAPLRSSPAPQASAAARLDLQRQAARRREVEWGRRRRREIEELDELERAIEKRKWVYRHGLYAKHVASNPYTRYRPFPTPAQFSASQDYVSRATSFIRRELMVWTDLDVEFLTTFIISIMKSLDIRSEPAIRLLSEFLDMDAEPGHERDNAEHFAHELYCYLRSPYRDLATYDRNVQYDVPPHVPSLNAIDHAWRWPSLSRPASPSVSDPRDRSHRSSSSPRARPDRQQRRRSQSASGHRTRASQSPRCSPRRREYSESTGRHSSAIPSRNTRFGEKFSPSLSPPRQPSDHDISSTGGVCHLQHDTPREPRNSHRHRANCDRKGKRRADDRADTSDNSSYTPTSCEVTTAGGDVLAGMQGNVKLRALSRASGENHATSSPTLSTLPCATNMSATIAQSAEASSAASLQAPPINFADKLVSTQCPLPAQRNVRQASGLQDHSPSHNRPPIRIRRNPWQTMQEYLVNGVSDRRPSQQGARVSGAELSSVAQSQVRQDAAFSPRDEALRPEDPSLSGEAVPSLLMRLSDPVQRTPRVLRDFPPASSDAARACHPGHEGGRRISASEMMEPTRTGSGTMSTADNGGASPSRTPSLQHSGAGRQSEQSLIVLEDSNVSAVEQVSSENCSQPGVGAIESAGSDARVDSIATSADPRSILMQKLEAAKRDTTDIPTAEKSQLSSAHRSSVPMALPGGSAGELSRSARDVLAAERLAERREAELRTQAQLRVRLATAKKAARRSGALPESGTGGSTATIDGDLAAQESSLRNRLKARQM